MKIFRFENIMNVVIYAFLTFILVIIVNQLDLSRTNNRYYNGFYGADSRKILINSKGTDFRIDTEALGTDFVLYDTVYDVQPSPNVLTQRVIYAKGIYPQPAMIDGHFFTYEEIVSKEKTCVVGSGVVEGIREENGEKYYQHGADNYRVIGTMGLDAASDLDLIVIFNWGGYYDNDKTVNTNYMIDSDIYQRTDEVFNAIWNQLEEYKKEHPEIVFENIYYENSIRGFEYYSRHLYFWGTVLVFLNLFIVSARYSSRNVRNAAVKRLVGVPAAGIVASVAGRYALTALTGVIISFLCIRFLNVNATYAKSEFAYFSNLSSKIVIIVIACTLVISIICGLIPALRVISKHDISDEVK